MNLIQNGRRGGFARGAFTLVELLVVIGIIALLIGILLPTLSRAREASKTVACASNLRQMQTAQFFYTNDNNGWLVQAGLGHPEHDGDHGHIGASPLQADDDHDDHEGHEELDRELSWLRLLAVYAEEGLVSRCPSDASPHWPEGVPAYTDEGVDIYRRTSYGINNYLSVTAAPHEHEGRWVKITQVPDSSAIVQFLEMAETGTFAAADHPELQEIDTTSEEYHEHASEMLNLGVHFRDGNADVPGPKSKANYSFLDGHVETKAFDAAYVSPAQHDFNPETKLP